MIFGMHLDGIMLAVFNLLILWGCLRFVWGRIENPTWGERIESAQDIREVHPVKRLSDRRD